MPPACNSNDCFYSSSPPTFVEKLSKACLTEMCVDVPEAYDTHLGGAYRASPWISDKVYFSHSAKATAEGAPVFLTHCVRHSTAWLPCRNSIYGPHLYAQVGGEETPLIEVHNCYI